MPRDARQFGRLLKAWRLSRGYGLRKFARVIGEFPSNLAAIESGQRNPWIDAEKLRKVAEALALTEGSRDWNEFFGWATDSKVTADLDQCLERDEVVVLLRTVNNKRLTAEQVQEVNAFAESLQGKANARNNER